MIFLRCPRCFAPVIVSCHYIIGTTALFEPQPFDTGGVVEAEDLTRSQRERFWQELPWRLGLGYLLPDKAHATYDQVQKRAKSRPYPQPWWRRHECSDTN